MSKIPVDGIITLVTLIVNAITSIVTSIFSRKKPVESVPPPADKGGDKS